MKNVIKVFKNTVPEAQKSAFASFSVKSAAASALGLSLTAILLAGCFDPDIQPSVVRETVNTEVTVRIEENTGDTVEDTSMPYGVTLQADPSVLVKCDLERVVDGDTIIVHNPDGDRLRVRLTGINAPESVHEDESKNTEEGRDASKFMKELLEDVEVVYLEYDVEEFDQYERTLAYVWIDSGDTYVMVNEIMLATDHAEPVYIKPNLRYADTFRQYEG
jgi:endonuclease YncB( thermonuclease family)